jgi:hypothetical protein
MKLIANNLPHKSGAGCELIVPIANKSDLEKKAVGSSGCFSVMSAGASPCRFLDTAICFHYSQPLIII